MKQAKAILEIEQRGEMLVLEPVLGLHALDGLEMEGAVDDLLERMDRSGVTDVFLDLRGIDVVRSLAPRLAVELWRGVRSQGGSMAIGLI